MFRFTGRCAGRVSLGAVTLEGGGAIPDPMARRRRGLRYGAIRWVHAADPDDAIRAVRACRSIADARRFLLKGFTEGDRWAIVDLRSLSVLSRGSTAAALLD
jgi:hypothetical protein